MQIKTVPHTTLLSANYVPLGVVLYIAGQVIWDGLTWSSTCRTPGRTSTSATPAARRCAPEGWEEQAGARPGMDH